MFFLQKKWGAKTKSKRKLPLPLLSKIGGWGGGYIPTKGMRACVLPAKKGEGTAALFSTRRGQSKRGGMILKMGAARFW
jgi:hypothetical protein